MRYFYKTQDGFYFPTRGADQPPIGTVTPYLRPEAFHHYIGDPVTGVVDDTVLNIGPRLEMPMDVVFKPKWPETPPQLRIGETLTDPKLGLPAVRGQSSAELIYQQSVALEGQGDMSVRRKSATLFDPTRAKKYFLGPGKLNAIPKSVNTSNFLGKTYFPNLPPHMSNRLFFDPIEGKHGALVFIGEYKDEPVGEKYLLLNVMSDSDLEAAIGLTSEKDAEFKHWKAAIEGLSTSMETFIEDPARKGTFIALRPHQVGKAGRPKIFIDGVARDVPATAKPWALTRADGSSLEYDENGVARPPDPLQKDDMLRHAVGPTDMAEVYFSDTPVDSYAISAAGGGTGYVVLAVGNSINTDITPAGEPVSLHVFKVGKELYRGELKVITSANPLDEKLTLQHTGDFAGEPGKYDFEWRYAPPVDGLPPRLYSFGRTVLVGDRGAEWRLENNPILAEGRNYIDYRSPSKPWGEGIASIEVKSHGTGYTKDPEIEIVGGGGSGVVATAGLQSGAVHHVTVENPGYGFTKQPDNVKFLKTDGSGATFNVVLTNSRISPTGQIVVNDGNGTAEHGVTLPNALLRRTFTVDHRPMRLFLSMELGDHVGAIVYINDAEVASYNAPGRVSSVSVSPPATNPPFEPLPLFFEIHPDVLHIDEVKEATGANNVVTVDLYSTGEVGALSTFHLRLEGLEEIETLDGWLAVGKGDGELSEASKVNAAATPETTGIEAVSGKNRHTIEGASILTLSDNYFIMRYRAREADNGAFVDKAGWSHWTEPQLAEGWIKRVLAGINPFQQRIKDLFNHEVNTSVSLVQQAGKRWEGDIALTLDSVNDSGLIEIYETVLRRGKSLSIDGTPPINYGGANDALLLAAGYLNDLYMILGNEAFADAENSTISFDTSSASNFVTQFGDVATSLFAFKGQLSSVLEEELALLRGRDDFLLPGVRKRPIYNRLIWNYTRGIDSGEAVYALNYNIKDVAWDMSINPNNPANQVNDGIISAADAAVAYPQGHGDAYGHYLTALTGYYGLLADEDFTWSPRIEAVQVLGTPVCVDYQDERKFAAAAAAIARTSSRIVDLTYRKDFLASQETGWDHLSETAVNADTSETRTFGTDDWAVRGGQGALFHWATANSLLPGFDQNPKHSGIQKIDRTTTPELAEIAAQAEAIQMTLDHADAGLNPLGFQAGSLAFDISAAEVAEGKTHFEQVYDRAIVALGNAQSAFENANASTRFLRQQDNSLEEKRHLIEAQERAFTNRLIALYGSPYADDIGPGRTYAQGYEGPDLVNHLRINLTELVGGFSAPDGLPKPKEKDLEFGELEPGITIFKRLDNSKIDGDGDFEVDKHDLDPDKAISDPVFVPFPRIDHRYRMLDGWEGRRASPGEIQTAVSDMMLARQALYQRLVDYRRVIGSVTYAATTFRNAVQEHDDVLAATVTQNVALAAAGVSIVAMETASATAAAMAEDIAKSGAAGAAGLPRVNGITANDVTSAGRAGLLIATAQTYTAALSTAKLMKVAAKLVDKGSKDIERATKLAIAEISWGPKKRLLLGSLKGALKGFVLKQEALDVALRNYDQAKRDLDALLAEGNRIQKERLVFRERSAAVIQGYRTHDFAFRAFRDEALEHYDALFDLAAQYTYLAALAYDYETGLLDTSSRNSPASRYFEDIVSARALGVLRDGVPQFAGSDSGDPGLSGVLARLSGDWSVVRSRLGFNNPDRDRTTFSLRWEKFRNAEEDTEAWKTALKEARVEEILHDPDVRRHVLELPGSDEGTPGLIIPFSTMITPGLNFFGEPLMAGDHQFSPSAFATKIRAAGIGFDGYDPGPGGMSATPYVYLIPVGSDIMRSPPLGDQSRERHWTVEDQAIPLPFNISESTHSSRSVWQSAASLSEPAFTLRRHPAFRAVPNGTDFAEQLGFTNSRLVGRSAWNTQWKLVIPGTLLLADGDEGLDKFIETVSDIKLHLETYSYWGN